METNDLLRQNARRDARDQLARRIGLGYAWPLNTTVVSTEHVSADPEDVNTLQRIYSKVSFNHTEHIFVHQPQAGVKYWLVDEETIDFGAPPPDKEAAMRAQLKALAKNQDRQAMAPDYIFSQDQPNLVLTTPSISNRDQNFVIIAEDRQRQLLAVLQTRITVKAGVDINLAVSARPAKTADSTPPWVRGRRVTIDYQTTVQVRVRKAQAECLYRLADVVVADPVPTEEEVASPEGFLFRSAIDQLGENVRNALLTSEAFAENTELQVYARFANTVNDGYLLQRVLVMVRPNRGLQISAELSDTTTKEAANKAPVVENPANHPHTVYYQGSAGLVLHNTQASTAYRIKLHDIDIAADVEVGSESATDDLRPHMGQLWSEPANGNGGDLTIPCSRSFTNDPTFQVEAIDLQYGSWTSPAEGDPNYQDWDAPVVLEQTVQFHVYPDPSPTVVSPPEPVPAGSQVIVAIQDTQEGVSYQLFRKDTDQPVGEPQYHSKNKTLGFSIVGVDLSPNAFVGDVVQLVAPDVQEDLKLYVKATKPTSGLTIRLTQLATIKIAT
ncbi:MAG TPA: hypothetical protein DCE41_37380 [Cytophagales bacterium]|nr:hypothetical protein [Cytophagales bacterium]HAP59953.1 hypothetical protein [Cytophagales bacterium]